MKDYIVKEIDLKNNNSKSFIIDENELERIISKSNIFETDNPNIKRIETKEIVLFDEDLEIIENAIYHYPLSSFGVSEIIMYSALLKAFGVDVLRELDLLLKSKVQHSNGVDREAFLALKELDD